MQGTTPEINDINITVVFPFLNTGQMFAVFHMAGIVPDSYDILNMTVSIGAMNGASFFKTLGVILSGTVALVGFSLLRSFSTPGTVMLMSFISGVVPCILQWLENSSFETSVQYLRKGKNLKPSTTDQSRSHVFHES
jgi:O-antigen ligase